MEGLETKERPDELLRPFLSSHADAGETENLLAAIISEHAQPIIRGIVKEKLRVSLRPQDGDHLNQDALEVCGEVNAMLLAQLHDLKSSPGRKTINNFRSYVAVVTYNACHEYLRRRHPRRHSLKNRLRYLLTHRAGLALWEGESGELLCGEERWRGARPAVGVGERLQRLAQGSSSWPLPAGANPGQAALAELVPTLLGEAGGPLELDELTSVVAYLQGIQDRPDERQAGGEGWEDREEGGEDLAATLPDTRAGVDKQVDLKIYLERLWEEIRALLPRQRAALLLNLKDAQGNSMVEMLPLTGIASHRQIAEALEIPAKEFAALWAGLPLDDNAIAARLGISRQQVINLRKSARDRLARRMRGF